VDKAEDAPAVDALMQNALLLGASAVAAWQASLLPATANAPSVFVSCVSHPTHRALAHSTSFSHSLSRPLALALALVVFNSA
jgi:hypothetical protein